MNEQVFVQVQEQLATLLKLGRLISNETDLDRVLVVLADTAREILDADYLKLGSSFSRQHRTYLCYHRREQGLLIRA